MVPRAFATKLALAFVPVLLLGTFSVGWSAVGPAAAAQPAANTYVPAQVRQSWKDHPRDTFNVIVQGPQAAVSKGIANSVRANPASDKNLGQKRQFVTVPGASSATMTGAQLTALSNAAGITAITSDARVQLVGALSSRNQWPYASGVARGWPFVTNGSLPQAPAIAIVDSGVDAGRSDFGGRVVRQVTLTSLPGNSAGDGRGHGTFVAGIAAGSAPGHTGAAPSAPLVSIDVMDDQGMGLTSDVIAAADWIYQNKSAYNIRVANFSLHTTAPASVFFDPLDKAVEKLWLSGVFVVAASGNYGVGGQPSGVLYAPGNDPFVLTVGAADINGSVAGHDDVAAPWSSYGYTYDGFAKPELAAPGRYMIGPVPSGSTLTTERPASITTPGYMQLSGTSFAAPVVAGTAAYLLARHPTWTPDQVKGALMVSAKPSAAALPFSLGVGEVNEASAALVTDPPNPNLALQPFVVPDPAGGPVPVFDAASWGSAAASDASWGSASWGSASWGSASWGSASWGSAFWSSASWATASWGSASWDAASWGSASWGSALVPNNADGDLLPGGSYFLDPTQQLAAELGLGITIGLDGSVSLTP